MLSFFERLVDPFEPYAETDRPERSLSAFFRSMSAPFRRIFIFAVLSALLVAVIEILLLWYLARLVDLLGASTPDQVFAAHGAEFAVAIVFILLLRPLVQAVNVGLINNAIMPQFGALVRWRSHRHVLRQSVGFFENEFAGRISNRVMQTPSSAGEVVYQIFDAIAFSLAYLAGALVLLTNADARLAVPIILWFALYLILLRWTVQRVGPASKASSDARSNLTGRIVDSYTNIHSVKLFANHDQELDYAKEGIEATRATFAHEMRIFTAMEVFLVLLNGFLIVSLVGWAVLLWSQQAASIGIVAAATALALRLNGMTGWLMWAISTLFRELGVVDEGLRTITHPLDLTDQPGATPLAVTRGEIRFDAISHHYGRAAGGLDEISLHIQGKQKLGIVGRSGAGKTTLVKLLLRFHDVEAGQIEIDGQAISAVTQDSLRNAIGMVQQDTALLHRSVRDNIRYGCPTASEQQIIEAAKRAGAHDFILDLQDSEGRVGYEAKVGERGVKLSGGQRQRIALARTILKDAPILVLDEATSALDSEVEALIQSALEDVMRNKTVIAIAHRLSTLRSMDRIVVIDAGRIVEDGTHETLLAAGGLYAQYWARQSGGFIRADAS